MQCKGSQGTSMWLVCGGKIWNIVYYGVSIPMIG
jgi:hypothetical protein